MPKHSTTHYHHHHHLHQHYPRKETKATRGLGWSYLQKEEREPILFFRKTCRAHQAGARAPIQGPWKDSRVRAAQGPE